MRKYAGEPSAVGLDSAGAAQARPTWSSGGCAGDSAPSSSPIHSGTKTQAGRWHAGPGDTAASLIAELHAASKQTRAIASTAELPTDTSIPGGRFSDNDPRPLPTLAWILSYILPRSMPATPDTWTSHGN